MKYIFIYLIKLYKLALSPIFSGSCRFYPSCSDYSLEAFQTHGSIKGSWLAVSRILRCNPLSPGGLDPVPEKKHNHSHNHNHCIEYSIEKSEATKNG